MNAGGNLVLGSSGGELPLEHHHPERHQEHDQSVARVAEHHREQERKRDDRVRRCIQSEVYRVRVHAYCIWYMCFISTSVLIC